MSKKEIVKHYEKEGFTVVWKPAKCIHSEICVKTLPKVYRPDDKPWIRPEAASINDLKDQIRLCPSGALTYQTQDQNEMSGQEAVEIKVLPGGPLLVSGKIKLEIQGQVTSIEQGNTAFCRCGASMNKPFCDGSHKTLDFE